MDISVVTLENLRSFEAQGTKTSNDSLTKTRERLLEALVNLIFVDPGRIDEVSVEVRSSAEFRRISGRVSDAFLSLKALALDATPGPPMAFSRLGGRSTNHDGVAEYRTPSGVEQVKVELKRGSSIYQQPEFAQYYVTKVGLQGEFCNYAEYVYDTGLVEQLCEMVGVESPSRDHYLQEVPKTKSEREPFASLRSRSKADSKFKRRLAELSHTSISEYLAELDRHMPDGISMVGIQEALASQEGKYFLSIHDGPEPYRWESFDPAALQLTGEHRMLARRNGLLSTLVLPTKSAASIQMLLRWKNGQPILGPAWQVKMVLENN